MKTLVVYQLTRKSACFPYSQIGAIFTARVTDAELQPFQNRVTAEGCKILYTQTI